VGDPSECANRLEQLYDEVGGFGYVLTTTPTSCMRPLFQPQFILVDDILFLASNGMSLNVSSVNYIVAEYVKRAGIRKKISVHTPRHTFGTHKADRNMGIAALQELMGHKKKET
jgi:site-specific recombinase XerD